MKRLRFVALVFQLLIFSSWIHADEGMYPVSEIHKLNLKAKGLKIKPTDIYNPNGMSLAHAIVSLGFCTGFFVSDQGLVLTNHHCAFGAVQSASGVEQDYIRDGFLANTRKEEIPAKGYTVRITERYADVTRQVMRGVSDTLSALDRAKTIQQNMQALTDSARKQHPNLQIEIMEMLPGKSYVMFYYTLIKDIRLVYVPPRSIGEFGGEDDNWLWPRHTGDFAFIRAYVSKDGRPADYSPDNVPYKPQVYLKISAEGMKENDFVFILGYPGRTFRHRPAEYVAYEEEIRMPYLADLMEWQIRAMQALSREDHATSIKLAQRIKNLANTSKNYRGKLKSMKALNFSEKRRADDQALWAYIQADPNRQKRFGSLAEDIRREFDQMRALREYEIILEMLRRSVNLVDMGCSIVEAVNEFQKPEEERRAIYKNDKRDDLIRSIQAKLVNYHEMADRLFLADLLKRSAYLPESYRFTPADRLLVNKEPDELVKDFFTKTLLNKDTAWVRYLHYTPNDLRKASDPLMVFISEYYGLLQQLQKMQNQQAAVLNKLYADYIDVRSQYLQTSFIPDANRTLRFTFGYIRGYSPADAVYYKPFTTLQGILQKSTGQEPFDAPPKLIDLAKKKHHGRYRDKKLNDVPVAMLYNADTTGGNSGSPVMNARGEVVGLNFDRAFEATINDFAWDESYSRSIGVDVRYILWVLEHFAGAHHLLKEIGIPG